MIINAHPPIASSLLNAATARPPKAKSSAPADADTSLADRVMITSQNMASTVAPLQDGEATRAALQSVRKQFLAQPNVAMLAQANQLPQNALRLLQ